MDQSNDLRLSFKSSSCSRHEKGCFKPHYYPSHVVVKKGHARILHMQPYVCCTVYDYCMLTKGYISCIFPLGLHVTGSVIFPELSLKVQDESSSSRLTVLKTICVKYYVCFEFYVRYWYEVLLHITSHKNQHVSLSSLANTLPVHIYGYIILITASS